MYKMFFNNSFKNSFVCLLLYVSASILLSGCDFGRRDKIYVGNGVNQAPYRATSRPYQIKGVWYYPQQHYDYSEMGIASWYGPGFHKNKASTGEVFDQNKISAAHKTLPLPSIALVTNLENGRMLKVKINDRGPFVPGRIIDLSKKAAELLGVLNSGLAKVKVDCLVEESIALNSGIPMQPSQKVNFAASADKKMTIKTLDGKPATTGSKPTQAPQDTLFAAYEKTQLVPEKFEQGRVQNYRQVYIQLGAFAKQTNATNIVNKLSKLGRTFSTQIQFGSQPIHRVRMGPFINAKEADIMLQKLVKMGHQDVKIVVE